MKVLFELLRETVKQWQADQAPTLAASLAYYTVFSLAPLLIILISLLTLLGQGGAQATILAQAQALLGDDGAGLVADMIESRAAAGGNIFATLAGVGVMLVGATGLFAQLQSALNTIWNVKPNPDKAGLWHLLRVRLLSLGMILTVGFLLLVSLVVTAVLEGITASANNLLPGTDLLWTLLNWGVSLGIITLLFALIYKYLPDIVIPWRTVWVGAFFTALLFVVGKQLLGLYLSRPALSSAYGAAGSLVVLLLWVFYSAQILLFGGEFTQVYAKMRGEKIKPSPVATRQPQA